MKEFNRNNLNLLRAEITDSLNKIGEKHDLKLFIKGITFGDTSFTTQLECNILTEKGTPSIPEYIWRMYGFAESPAGKEFSSNGESFIFWNIATKNSKYPFIVRRKDGKLAKFVNHPMTIAQIEGKMARSK